MKIRFMIFAVLLTFIGCGEKRDVQAVSPEGGHFRIDAASLGPEEVRFYSYAAGGRPITFMVARSPSGVIKTAFDACVSCYENRMGYRREGGSVICIYCGNSFRIEGLDEGMGSCHPIKIEHRLEGNFVLIGLKDIKEGQKWF